MIYTVCYGTRMELVDARSKEKALATVRKRVRVHQHIKLGRDEMTVRRATANDFETINQAHSR